MRKIIIIGGGLAGLITSIQLVRAGIPCTVIEKKSYPLHRVCGEYVSNEALPFLKSSGLYPKEMKLPEIKFFQLSSGSGQSANLALDLGGFGISRYSFDTFLYNTAKQEGVFFQLNTEVTAVSFRDDGFEVETQFGKHSSDLVIGSFGKRSKLDVQQDRDFIKNRSPYVGVKYHVRTDRRSDLISLHNFEGGYCGVCNVEDGITNLCYLSHRDQLKNAGDIRELERKVLFRNPHLKQLFLNSQFLFERPEVINEISFATKKPVENHILMAGDAAGMITPVCGNGMAMAIHSAKVLSEFVVQYCNGTIRREELEQRYARAWLDLFQTRLWIGRNIQRVFGGPVFSTMAVIVARSAKPLADFIVRKSHGITF